MDKIYEVNKILIGVINRYDSLKGMNYRVIKLQDDDTKFIKYDHNVLKEIRKI